MPSSTDTPKRPPQRGNVPAQRPAQQAPAVVTKPDPWAVLKLDLDRNRDVYGALLGGTKPAPTSQIDRFLMSCYQVVWNKPDLIAEPMRDSLLLAFAEGAATRLDFSPTAKEAFIEIRDGKARFATQYPGLVKLIHRGNDIDYISVGVVRRGDHFRQVGGSDPHIDHVAVELGHEPDDYDTDDAILATYACVKLLGSSKDIHEVARKADFNRAKAMSKGPAWKNWYDRMAMKVPLRRLANRLPKADEARHMLEVEDAQDQGETVTLDRVRELFGDRMTTPPRAIPSAGTDELRSLMDASGPVTDRTALPSAHPDAEPPEGALDGQAGDLV